MAKTIKLTDEQKERAIKEFKTDPHIMNVTKKVFGNDALDGRSKEGKAVSDFLVERGLKPKTTKKEEVGLEELTTQQKSFLMSASVDVGMNALEVAKLTYQDESILPLSKKHRTILNYLKEHRPEIVDDEEVTADKKWTPPHAVSRAVDLTNKWAGQNIDKLKLTNKQKQQMEQLLIYLKSPRFGHFINNFKSLSDRELFEAEFVRSVWNKSDLTNDELNVYVTVCTNYIRQKHIQRRIDRLNRIAGDVDTDQEMTIRFTELLKGTNDELNQCEKRIETAINALNGKRQERLKGMAQKHGSILSFVNAFTDKEERDRLVRMADLRLKLEEERADDFETMDEMKARIIGISKDELL